MMYDILECGIYDGLSGESKKLIKAYIVECLNDREREFSQEHGIEPKLYNQRSKFFKEYLESVRDYAKWYVCRNKISGRVCVYRWNPN